MAAMAKFPESALEPEFNPATDPFALFEQWFADASAAELNDPNALALASVDADGMPNVRMVLLKGLDAVGAAARGFVFYTNVEGTKGRELLAHPKAAMAFHWKSLERQVRIRGPVTVVSDAEADAYFASRPRDSRIGAWASQQSRPVQSRAALEAEVARFAAKFATGDIPRPPYWSGFRVVPDEIEFWRSRPYRLHDRAVFKRSSAPGAWSVTRLFP
jgi:pyridoxamine 5'-phosphate oxidase